MKKLLFFFAVLLPLHLLAQTTYYVSNSGSDSNSGTSESSPWESLTKVNSYSFSPGDQILFKRGDQWEGTINVNASGSSGNPIVYGAYGNGDTPKIYGSEEITGWTLYSGNIYKSTVGKEVTQLFIDGERATIARYPKIGYLNITSVNSPTEIVSTELESQAVGYYNNALLLTKSTSYRFTQHKVTNSNAQTLSLDSSPAYNFDEGEGFFLYNKLEFLTEAGEWCYDSTTQTVYVWLPNNALPGAHEIKGSVYDNGITLGNNIDYVNITNLGLYQQGENGIYMYASDNITIDSNSISECAGIAINCYYVGNSLVFKNNNISDVFERAININYGNSTNLIDGNIITKVGRLTSLGSRPNYTNSIGTAITSLHGNCNIQYNKITNCGYNAIYFNSGVCNIYRNFINNVLQELDDGGAIYSFSGDYTSSGIAGSIISENIILNVLGEPEGTSHSYHLAFGIYLDYLIHDATIEDNLIAMSSGGINLNQGGKNLVQNNTFFDCLVDINSAGQRDSNTVENNIMYKTDRHGTLSMLGNTHQRFVFETGTADSYFDNNIYIVPYTENNVFVGYQNFEAWQAQDKDINGVYDGIDMQEGETEKVLYNETEETKTFYLGNNTYKDIYGDNFSGTLTLEPFTSKILIGSNINEITEINDTDSLNIEGNTEVYNLSVTMSDRRAIPVTFTKYVEINSISIYHNGGTGNLLVGVYSDDNGSPDMLLGKSLPTELNNNQGWQTISLSDDVSVSSGEKVWLAWIFENSTEVRYKIENSGCASSNSGWSEGLPISFNNSSTENYIYSAYCNYTSVELGTQGITEVYTSSTSWANRRAVPVTFDEAGEIESISIYHNGGTGDVLLAVYSDQDGTISNLLGVSESTAIDSSAGWQTISLTEPVIANSGKTVWLAWVFENNPGIRYSAGGSLRAHSSETWSSGMPDTFGDASYANAQYSIYCNYIPIKLKTEGITEVYASSTSWANRRAVPVTFDEVGEIESISMYHNGGTGDVLLAVYSEQDSTVSNLLGVTNSTAINSSAGWQTVNLIEPVTVYTGETVWLAWVFENNPGIRYSAGGSLRAHSNDTWSEGMPEAFGNASYANAQYSIYCNYIPIKLKTEGITEVYTSSTSWANRRAVPVTFSEAGEIESISMYHNGGTGDVLLAVYSDQDGAVSNLLGVTDSTAINNFHGWQTLKLLNPVAVDPGETVWLAWVFENNPGIRYSLGGDLLRAHSDETWSSGMPDTFGIASYAYGNYSIYCNYIKSLTKSATISPSKEPTTIAANNLTQFSKEEITITEGETYLSWTEPGTYQRVLTAYSGADSIVTTILTIAPAALVSKIDKHDTPNLEVDEKSSVIAEYFKVYPNPANTYVNIECEAVPDIQTKLIIMNSSGETLLNTLVESTLTRMDISHLPAGIYFIRMVNGKNDRSKKLIVTNKKR